MLSFLTAFPSKLIEVAFCAALFWVGGYCWKPARRFIMPFILVLMAFLATNDPWVGTMLSVIGIFCLGYGEDSLLRHCFGNGWGRGVWGVLAAICLSVPLLLTHHFGVSIGFLKLNPLLCSLEFALYLALNFTLENALKNFNEAIGDPIIGLGFASILLLIH